MFHVILLINSQHDHNVLLVVKVVQTLVMSVFVLCEWDTHDFESHLVVILVQIVQLMVPHIFHAFFSSFFVFLHLFVFPPP